MRIEEIASPGDAHARDTAQRPPRRAALFAPLPVDGPWTALHLTRAQFCAILLGATLVYLLTGGPLWSHLRENDFVRIVTSYAVIPPAVALALWRNGALRLTVWLAASGVLAMLKLLLTAAIALLLGIAAG